MMFLRCNWSTVNYWGADIFHEPHSSNIGELEPLGPHEVGTTGWTLMSHAPSSPDLNSEDYNIWLEMWQRVYLYQTKFSNAKELNQHMLDMRHDLKQSIVDDAFGYQLHVIDDVPVHVMTLLAFNLFHIIHLQSFCLFILWKLEVNRHCCVKYTSILLFLILCISQGRKATCLRCSSKCYSNSVANFLLSSAVKEFLKSPNICPSYERM